MSNLRQRPITLNDRPIDAVDDEILFGFLRFLVLQVPVFKGFNAVIDAFDNAVINSD